MLRIGITGGIGSGKSRVCTYFEKMQVPVYYADTEAGRIIDTDPRIRKKLLEYFGARAYTSRGLNKAFIRKKVFGNAEAIAFLNATTHPVVIADFVNWCKTRKKEKHRFVLKEAALIFESGSDKELDFIVCVTAPEEERIQRVVQRDKRTPEEVLSIFQRQMPEAEKIRLSNAVIYNSNDTLLLPQLVALEQQFKTLSTHGI